MTYQLHLGDCLDIMPTLEAGSVDALIMDPPAGISFMQKSFDSNRGGRDKWIAWLSERLRAARRLLKPGHYGLVWALPRVSHWTGMACEDAGFIVEDVCFHAFGSGLPKNKNKLKPAVECWWLVRNPGPSAPLNIDACRGGAATGLQRPERRGKGVTGGWAAYEQEPGAYGTPDGSGRWPAHLILQHSAGCVPCGVKRTRSASGTNGIAKRETAGYRGGFGDRSAFVYADADGTEQVDAWRCQDGCAVRALGEMSGELTSGDRVALPRKTMDGWGMAGGDATGDTGTAARYFTNLDPPFFYAAKASRRERSDGCDGLYWLADDTRPSGYRPITSAEYAAAQEAGERVARGNMHPCVKSLKLISWLCTLISSPGDVVLDPFMGSGSIGVAALGLGRQFVGVEMDEDYLSISEARLAHAAARPQQMEIAI